MSADSHAHEHHVTSVPTLVATFTALVAFTWLTYEMAHVNLGRADIWVTLGIATVKAGLVAAIFMHLRNDKALNGIILMSTLGFVSLFIAFALTDTGEYQPNIKAYSEKVQQDQHDLAGP